MQLGFCPEAASHLQDMKDNLIAIFNELLDNGENLNSTQIAKLRHDRCAFLWGLHPVFSIFIIYHIQSKKKAQGLHHRFLYIYIYIYSYAESLYLKKKNVTAYSF